MREMLDIFALLALVGYSGFIVYLAYHYIKNKFLVKINNTNNRII